MAICSSSLIATSVAKVTYNWLNTSPCSLAMQANCVCMILSVWTYCFPPGLHLNMAIIGYKERTKEKLYSFNSWSSFTSHKITAWLCNIDIVRENTLDLFMYMVTHFFLVKHAMGTTIQSVLVKHALGTTIQSVQVRHAMGTTIQSVQVKHVIGTTIQSVRAKHAMGTTVHTPTLDLAWGGCAYRF